MFGYIKTAEDIEKGAKGLNQAFMCGLCISTKRLFGNVARLTVNNDINFFNVLFHSYLDKDIDIYKARCMSSMVKKTTILQPDDITDKLSIANVMLAYLNMLDDVIDGSASFKKKIGINTFAKTYHKAVSQWQELNDCLTAHYDQLRVQERQHCDSIDRVCHSFAQLSADFARLVLPDAHPRLIDLCYNVGKWIYLIDALDDIDKDIKRGDYNLFLSAYSSNSRDVVASHREEIEFVMYSALNSIAIAYNDLALVKYRCILDSIIYQYIRTRTQQVLQKYTPQEDK